MSDEKFSVSALRGCKIQFLVKPQENNFSHLTANYTKLC